MGIQNTWVKGMPTPCLEPEKAAKEKKSPEILNQNMNFSGFSFLFFCSVLRDQTVVFNT